MLGLAPATAQMHPQLFLCKATAPPTQDLIARLTSQPSLSLAPWSCLTFGAGTALPALLASNVTDIETVLRVLDNLSKGQLTVFVRTEQTFIMLVSMLSLVYQEMKDLTALSFYNDAHQKHQLKLLKLFMRPYTGSISTLSKMRM